MISEWKNTLYYGENLAVMREYLPDESADLIYLDPPFNSNRNYNVLFREESGADSQAQITAFEDTWQWDEAARETYYQLIKNSPENVSRMIGAFHDFIGRNQMMAYLVMMTIRLIALRRILKSTGSLYLHCDPTASHYLKIVLDTIFGKENFRNEIIWCYKTRHFSKKHFGKKHDVVLYYSKTDKYLFNWDAVLRPLSESTIKKYRLKDERGYYRLCGRGITDSPIRSAKDVDSEWEKTHPELVIRDYLKDGVPHEDYWNIDIINQAAKERMGYPTQKPLALLERIIQASSNPGDVVLDPFCGCGTAIVAAQKLDRKWIGIDITHLAVALQKYRLKQSFDLTDKKDYEVIGEPEDLSSAEQLAKDDRYQFQWWALSLIQAKPVGGDAESKKGKKGKDRGIDGIISFIDDSSEKPKRVIVQVKSGNVGVKDIRDLIGTVEREKAAIGVFITLKNPSK
ncbi:MAG: site-specific DNA-methyltransferase, partial [Desulfobacteraceae bacterium IS3]